MNDKEKLDSIKNIISETTDQQLLLGMYYNEKEYYWEFGNFNSSNYLKSPHRSIYDIGSLSGSLAVLSILKSGIDINEPINRYIRQTLPMPLATMPVSSLLNHNSGLPEFGKLLLDNPDMIIVAENRSHSLYDKSCLDRDLETCTLNNIGQHRYSHIGIALAGKILEQTVGVPYETYVHRELLVPLGMSDSTYTIRNDNDRMSRFTYLENEYTYGSLNPALGLKSSSRDMMRYLKANLRLNNELQDYVISMQRKINSKHKKGSDPSKKYGLFWELIQGESVFIHSSISDEYSTVMCGHVDKPIGLYMYIRGNNQHIYNYGTEILNVLLR